MADNMVLLANRDIQNNRDSDLVATFIAASKANGYAFDILETNFAMAGRGNASEAYWERAGQRSSDIQGLPPLDQDAGALVVASPVHWFGLSIKQRTAIDTICARFFMNIDYSRTTKKCALVICSDGKEREAERKLCDVFAKTCVSHGVANCGLLTIITP